MRNAHAALNPEVAARAAILAAALAVLAMAALTGPNGRADNDGAASGGAARTLVYGL